EEALQQARQLDQARRETGFDQQALDAAAQLGLTNGAFEDSEDEAHQVLEECYPESSNSTTQSTPTPRSRHDSTPTPHELMLERSQRVRQQDPRPAETARGPGAGARAIAAPLSLPHPRDKQCSRRHAASVDAANAGMLWAAPRVSV